MHEEARSRDKLRAVYKKFKDREAHTLVSEFLRRKGIDNPEDYFGTEPWQGFRHAVNYRNLVVHECTYLGAEKFEPLVNGCQVVLERLARLAGLEKHSSGRGDR